MVRTARYVYAALAWAFLVGVVVQVFFIGLGLFAGSENLALHVNFGYILHLAPILILLTAILARVGRRQILIALALAVTVFIVPILAFPGLRGDMPLLAALHPVAALLAFWLSIVVARGATAAALESRADQPTSEGSEEGSEAAV
ncbi:MAG: DUF6220 domain-containing protein [Candidatus Limnocylindria bacterium]